MTVLTKCQTHHDGLEWNMGGVLSLISDIFSLVCFAVSVKKKKLTIKLMLIIDNVISSTRFEYEYL